MSTTQTKLPKANTHKIRMRQYGYIISIGKAIHAVNIAIGQTHTCIISIDVLIKYYGPNGDGETKK